MTKLKIVTAIVVSILSVLGCFYVASAFTASRTGHDRQPDRVITILKSENLDFLVRRRQVTQVVLIHTDESWLDWLPTIGTYRELKKEDGVLTANVRVYYGFDMKKLTNDSIDNTDDNIAVKLPDPEVLDFSVDLDSLKFVRLKTGVATFIQNAFRDETLKDKLLKEVKKAVEEFVSTPGAMPSKSEMLNEMGGFERILSDAYGVKVSFK
jgi:hypothetical protein